jgi:CHAD domain-containing protein
VAKPTLHDVGRTKGRDTRKEAAAVVAAVGAAAVGGKLVRDKLSGKTRDERAFRLYTDQPVPDGMRRIARGQIDGAAEDLRQTPKRKTAEAVHEARKRLKRLRASVRVSRDALGERTYQRENSVFRDAGRALSATRDSKVLIETLDELEGRFRAELDPGAIAALSSRLEDEHSRATESLKQDPAVIDGVLDTLRKARRRTASWRFDSDGFEALGPGVRRIYRRGRRRMRAAEAEPSTENFHEWRKRTKDLWHALQIVRPAAPKRLKAMARQAHDLSDLLGDDHDLAVLRDYVEAHRALLDDQASQDALLGLIDRRRKTLEAEALALGRRLYKRRPKAFASEIERGWRKRVRARPQRAAA